MGVLSNVLEVSKDDGGLGEDLKNETGLVYDELLASIVKTRREWDQGSAPVKNEPKG